MTNKFHNPKFYKLLKAAAKEASNLLHDIKSSKTTPHMEHKEGSINDVIVMGTFFKSCVQFLMEDLSIKRLGNIQDPEERREEIRKTIVSHIKKYLGNPYLELVPQLQIEDTDEWCSYSINGFLKEYNELTFDIYYTEYEKYLYTNEPLKYHIVAGLKNFSCDLPLPVIELSNNTRLISNKESFYDQVVHLKDPGYMRDPIFKGKVYNSPDFWLEIDCEMKKEIISTRYTEGNEWIMQRLAEEVKNVLKILWLYKEGNLDYATLYWSPETPCDPPYSNDCFILPIATYDNRPEKYLLQDDDIEKLQLLFEKYKNNSSKEYFPSSAINYLCKSVSETDTSKRLVDYAAALESLLVDGNEGITSQLSQNTALFIGKDKQRRKEISDDIKKAYSFRSKIVHGDYHKIKDKHKLEEYCNKTERYVRLAITKWIDLIDEGKTRQEIYGLIEEDRFA